MTSPFLTPAAAAWLQSHGAVDVRVGADDVIEFSARPLRVALTDAARDLMAGGLPDLRAVAPVNPVGIAAE